MSADDIDWTAGITPPAPPAPSGPRPVERPAAPPAPPPPPAPKPATPKGRGFDGLRLSERRREAVREANKTVRARMNAAKVIFPLLAAVEVRAPEGADGDEAVFRLFAEMVDVAGMLAEEVAKTVKGGDATDADWVRRSVMPLCAKMVADSWIDRQRPPADFDADALRARVSFALEQVAGYEGTEVEMDDQAAVQLSLLGAMMPVTGEIEANPLGHERQRLATRLSSVMMQGAEAAVANVAPDLASQQSRRMLLQGMLRHSGEIMAECYRREAQRVEELLSAMPQAEREAHRKRYPDGFPLEGVERAFQGRLGMVAACAVNSYAPEGDLAPEPEPSAG